MSEAPAGPPKLSAFDATLLVMGGIIGVGIFFTPQSVAERAFEPWAYLALWVFGGAIAMCAAFTFAELGGTFPRSGGWFVYLREAFGPLPAFLFAWIVLFVVSGGAIAVMAKICGNMLHQAFPEVVGAAGTAFHSAIGAGLILGVTGLTLAGVKSAARLQNFCMLVKLLTLAALILGGLVFLTPESAGDLGAALESVGPDESAGAKRSIFAGMVAALLPVFFAYGGWQHLGYIAPQVKDPDRVLPRSIVLGVGGVVTVYLLVNLAFLGVLGIDGVAGDADFAANLAQRVGGTTGRRLLAVGIAISSLGVCVVNIIATPWLYVAMAREKLFFQSFGALHATTGVPVRPLLIQAALSLLYLGLGTLQTIVDSVVFVEWFFHGLVALGLMRLRRLRPELPRPFRSFAYPLAPLVYLVAALLIVGGTLWQAELALKGTGLAVILAGVLTYGPWKRWMEGTAAPLEKS